MAKKARYDWGKSRSGRYQKFETRLMFKWTGAGADGVDEDSVYIDLAQCLSALNRKLVRQGQVFKVKSMRIFTNDDSPESQIKIGVLPRVWPMYNAYKKARSLWNQHNLTALQGVGGGNLPKYYDFKVFMEQEHFKNHMVTGGDDNLIPVDFEDGALSMGEWKYSKFHDAGDESKTHHLHILGLNCEDDGTSIAATTLDGDYDGGSVGAILAYELSRGIPSANQDASDMDQQSAANLATGPWGVLFGNQDQPLETITTQADDDNDDPPYDRDDMVGADNFGNPLTIYYGRLGQSSNASAHNLMVPNFEAPLGLIRIQWGAVADESTTFGGIHISMDVEIMGEV